MPTCATFHSRRTAAALAAAGVLAACHAPDRQAPVLLTDVALSVRYAVPAVTDSDGQADAPALAFTLELFATASPPAGSGVLQVAAAIRRDRGEPFRARSRVPIGTRWLGPDDVEAFREAAHTTDTDRRLLDRSTAITAGNLVTRIATAPVVTPELQLEHGNSPTTAALVTPADEQNPREELLLAADLSARPHGLYVPAAGGGGLVLLLIPTGAAPAAAVASAREQAAAANRSAPLPTERPLAWRVALAAVGEYNRRPALLALLARLERPRATDLVLAADERQLIAMTEALVDLDPSAPDVGFVVECAFWRTWIRRIERGDLTPAMQAAAARQLGALAEAPSTLTLLLQTCPDEAAFEQSLRDENLLALDDRSVALRNAACEWLADRGIVVPDYQPLADRSSRRRALRAFRRAQEVRQ